MFIFLSLQQVVNDGDDTSDESVESEWDNDDEHGTDDEEEEDSENGWLFLAAKLTSLYHRQLPLYSN
jgi:hypothetical protein